MISEGTLVIDLAAVGRFISILPEVLRQGNNVRVRFTEIGVVLDDVDRFRSSAGHEACSGRAADGLLAVGPVKEQTIGSKLVDIWRDGNLGTVASKLWPKIIDGNEEDIGSWLGLFLPAASDKEHELSLIHI